MSPARRRWPQSQQHPRPAEGSGPEAVEAGALRGTGSSAKAWHGAIGPDARSSANRYDCTGAFRFSSGLGMLQAAEKVTDFLFYFIFFQF